MTYRTEFPDFDPATMPALPAGFEDVSWHNDTCPTFTNGQVVIYVDYADPAEREIEGCERFVACRCDENGARLSDNDDVLIATDDWSELLAAVR